MDEILFGNDDLGSGDFAASIAIVASIVYSFKHIKSSSCLGSKCQQEVEGVVVVPVKLESEV